MRRKCPIENLNPAREVGETFEAYKARQRSNRERLKGFSRWINVNGQLIKQKVPGYLAGEKNLVLSK